MSFFRRRSDPRGTVLLCASPAEREAMREPSGVARNGPRVSWMEHLIVGDDQGQTSACQLFAAAKRYEIVSGIYVADTTVIHVYHELRHQLGRPEGQGLSTKEAVRGCRMAGWINEDEDIGPATLDDLYQQPLWAIYDADVFTGTKRNGCVNHNAWLHQKEFHAVCLVAKGPVPKSDKEWVNQAGSWGASYGDNGITAMTTERHREACRELWKVVKRR